jgi:hypothetical protein
MQVNEMTLNEDEKFDLKKKAVKCESRVLFKL